MSRWRTTPPLGRPKRLISSFSRRRPNPWSLSSAADQIPGSRKLRAGWRAPFQQRENLGHVVGSGCSGPPIGSSRPIHPRHLSGRRALFFFTGPSTGYIQNPRRPFGKTLTAALSQRWSTLVDLAETSMSPAPTTSFSTN
ncbi:hypothetical protein HPP92_028138 [Vanilla planifolia]|uniref:Uncharacterized protein n=1 Tax=Vanilla planifolia TaxID=51239 RepID=A0A835U4C4_VANPL|nr:hypothetical protein HPP92_028138 [Vanilla planifolia]KAG0447892.1 hypothetical protein HPP92_028117 [Vanilla planifolia]